MKRILAVSAALLAVGCSAQANTLPVADPTDTPTLPTVTETPPPDPVVMAAGDIACAPGDTVNDCHDPQTAALLAGADRVLTLGDNQYQMGTLTEFQGSYDLSWGAYKSITEPVPGNHEYMTANAQGYFDYFGVPPWYSYDVGAWHLVALNSSLPLKEGTEQNNWLEADLAANTATCTLAYMHFPRYSGGKYYPGCVRCAPPGGTFSLTVLMLC